MICAVCYAESLDELSRQLSFADKQNINIVALRVDGLEQIEISKIKQLIQTTSKPIILSSRSEWKNQSIQASIKNRRELMSKLISIEPQYIDLEYPIDIPSINQVKENTIIILSLLDFDGMAKIAFNQAIELAKSNPNIFIKISATPNSISDLHQIWRWSKQLYKDNIPHSIIGMGELGKLTRIKSSELRNNWTYGRISETSSEPFLPGMMEVAHLNKAFENDSWHLGTLGGYGQLENRFYELLYNQMIDHSDLTGVMINIPLSNSAELDQILLWINDGLLDGVNIQSQWQKDALTRVDHLHVDAVEVQRSNCIVISKNGLEGHNTEIEGLRRLLSPYSIDRLKRIYIEGDQNYIRTVASLLKSTAEQIVVRGANENNIKNLINDFPNLISSEDSFTEHYDLIINNSFPEKGFEKISPIPPNILKNSKLVIDLTSNFDGSSATLEQANKLNIPSHTSWEFLVNTSIRCFELWTNQSVPSVEIIKDQIIQNQFNSFNLNFSSLE